ncbi:putative uncharacterized protein DDB_G0277255 [Uloborus diversus]|uniref:putative uncharacterized protein DDB_G0277255 n=1 Tax=Uloborus diversus TaxID=327109 RepID=UPI00240A1EDE|nr:putative uncharacterized protein DDB_G0277255 [Uloborus diversus]
MRKAYKDLQFMKNAENGKNKKIINNNSSNSNLQSLNKLNRHSNSPSNNNNHRLNSSSNKHRNNHSNSLSSNLYPSNKHNSSRISNKPDPSSLPLANNNRAYSTARLLISLISPRAISIFLSTTPQPQVYTTQSATSITSPSGSSMKPTTPSSEDEATVQPRTTRSGRHVHFPARYR